MQKPGTAKKYISFAVFCLIILFLGILLSLPFSIEVRPTSEKPPILLAVLLLIASLYCFIMPLYLSYKAWVDGDVTREKARSKAAELAKRLGSFRFLVITNSSFLLWRARIVYPIVALLGLGLFVSILLSAF